MTKPTPTQICEDILRADIRYNTEHRIWPSLNAISERMLLRGVELGGAYDELVEKLGTRPQALKQFFDVLLASAHFHNQHATAQSRADRAELVEVNERIAELAHELAGFLDRRSELHNTTDFHSDTHYSVCGVIKSAAERRVPLFDGWVKEPLQRLSSQFDLKYWPTIGDFVRELADDAERAKPLAMNSATDAATRGKRASDTDFFSALFKDLEEGTVGSGGFLPRGFKLLDSSWAALGTCVLDRGPDEPFTAEYVKQLRQRLRRRAEA